MNISVKRIETQQDFKERSKKEPSMDDCEVT